MHGCADHFKYRWNLFKNVHNAINEHEGGMEMFTKGGYALKI